LLAAALFEDFPQWIFWVDSIAAGIAALLCVVFLRAEPVAGRTRKEQVEKGGTSLQFLLENRGGLLVLLSVFLLVFSYAQVLFALPLHLEIVFAAEGVTYYGTILSLNAVFVMFLTPALTLVTKSLDCRTGLAISGFLLALGLGSLFWVIDYWLLIVVTVIWTMGEILIWTNGPAFIANASPAHHRGRANALLSITNSLGFILAPLFVSGFLLLFPLRGVWLAVGAITLGCCFVLANSKHFSGRT